MTPTSSPARPSASWGSELRYEDGACLVDTHSVEYQVKAAFPFQVAACDALNRSSVVREHVIRATLADKFLVFAAAYADDEGRVHSALGDLNREVSDPA
jgi:hypothetical protein